MSEASRSVGAFIEAMELAASTDEVESAFLAATAHLGFAYAALFTCAAPDPGERPPLSYARLPAGWLNYYLDRRYQEIDPVFPAVRRRLTPFSWNDAAYRKGLTRAQKRMLAECGAAGIGDGLAIPIKGPSTAPGCCMLTPTPGGIDPQSFLVGHSLGVFAYACAQRTLGETDPTPNKLTGRERECLLLAARGKSDWAIGETLGLSERTVHHAIERAKQRYGAATRVRAIVHAISAGEFSATDALG